MIRKCLLVLALTLLVGAISFTMARYTDWFPEAREVIIDILPKK